MIGISEKTFFAVCCRMSILILIYCTFQSFAKTDIPVILLSGQSNMTGYADASGLTADQKKNIDNVKIFMDLVWEGDASKLRKWLTLGTGFGSNANRIGPELFLGRILSEAMPGKKIALIKSASGSTYLGKKEHWLPPSSNNGVGGDLYKRMMNTVDAAIKSFSIAFDTSQYTPRWAGFVWLQGEFDAEDLNLSNAYEKNLTNLINDIRSELNTPDLPIIIPMIDIQGQWTYHKIVRAANIEVVKKMKNVDTLDTKGFETDGTHYKAQGQVKIGTITAQRWLNMKYNYQGANYTLNIGTRGQGNVISIPDESSFENEAEVTITATPLNGWIFDGWSGDAIGTANPLKMTINATINITANFKTIDGKQDLLLNGSFFHGADAWTFNCLNGTGSGSVENGEYKLNISAIGDKYYDIQVVQSGILLEKGKIYRLIYDARASANRVLNVNVGMPVDTYTTFLSDIINGSKEVNLTDSKQSFSLDFIMKEETSEDSRLEFNVGLNTSTVYIDNISLFEVEPDLINAPLQNKRTDCINIHQNGSLVNIIFYTDSKNNSLLNLYDLKGCIVRSARFKTSAFLQNCSFSTADMANGFYAVKVTNGTSVYKTGLVLNSR